MANKICPSDWRHSLNLIDKSPAGTQKDDFGGIIASNPQVVAQLLGNLVPANAREVTRAMHRQIHLSHVFTTYYNLELTVDKYMTYQDPYNGTLRYFRIVGLINVDEAGMYHKVDLEEHSGV